MILTLTQKWVGAKLFAGGQMPPLLPRSSAPAWMYETVFLMMGKLLLQEINHLS